MKNTTEPKLKVDSRQWRTEDEEKKIGTEAKEKLNRNNTPASRSELSQAVFKPELKKQ